MAQRAHIAIAIDGTAVGYLRGAEVQTSIKMAEAAAEYVYGHVRRIPISNSWGASGNWFVPSGGNAGQIKVKDILTGRTTAAVVLAYGDGSTETGTAVITAWDTTGSVGSAIEGTFSLQGSGALVSGGAAGSLDLSSEDTAVNGVMLVI